MTITAKILYYIRAVHTRCCSILGRIQVGHYGKKVLFESVPTIEGGQHIRIGDYVYFAKGARLSTWGKGQIEIGSDCHFGENVYLTAASHISVGNYVLFGNNVLVSDNAHGSFTLEHLQIPPIERPLSVKGMVTIGDRVWIGQNVCILSGVTIADGAIIGANSVVTHDVPANSICAGVPAQIIRQL